MYIHIYLLSNFSIVKLYIFSKNSFNSFIEIFGFDGIFFFGHSTDKIKD